MKYIVGDVEFNDEDFYDAVDFCKKTKQSLLNENGVVLMMHKKVPKQIVDEINAARKMLN